MPINVKQLENICKYMVYEMNMIAIEHHIKEEVNNKLFKFYPHLYLYLLIKYNEN